MKIVEKKEKSFLQRESALKLKLKKRKKFKEKYKTKKKSWVFYLISGLKKWLKIIRWLDHLYRNKLEKEKFHQVLMSRNRNECAPPPPAQGIYLEKVMFL